MPIKGLSKTPCTFLITDETNPRPPVDCVAVKNTDKDISVKCQKGHDGGLPQVKRHNLTLISTQGRWISHTVLYNFWLWDVVFSFSEIQVHSKIRQFKR